MLKLLFTGTCISSENIMLSFFFYFQTIWKSSFIYLFLGVLPVSIKKYGAVIFRLFFTFFLIGIKNITKKREYLLFVLPFFLKHNTLKAMMLNLRFWKLHVSPSN